MEITKHPFLVSFAGNPMRYYLTPGSGGGDPFGVLSVIEIVFSDIDSTPDHAIELTFMGETKTFTLKNEPSTNGHLPIADDAWSATTWAKVCYEYLINNVELLESYDITNDTGNIIQLTAKTADPQYDCTEGANTITGITVTTVTAGLAATPGTIEGVLMRVYKNTLEVLGEDYKPVDSAGCVKFEIQEYIYASLLQAPQPRFHLTVPVFYYHLFYDYFIKYMTVFANRIAGAYSSRTYSEGFCYALAGGLNREDLVTNNNALTDYFSLTATKKKFLTWSPPSKLTDKYETHSLFFALQTPSYSQFRMKANLYDGSTGSTINITSLISAGDWLVYEFMAGYTQLQLSTQMSGNVERWELYLVDENGTVISDFREFILDPKYYENTRYFRFRNSFGTYDSLRCTGVFETIIEHEREKVIFMSDDTETMYNTPGAYSMIKEAQSFKANSGWLTRDYLNYLRDFMLSSEIFEVEDGKLLKCLLTSKKTSMFKDANYNYSLAFEYERAWDDFFF